MLWFFAFWVIFWGFCWCFNRVLWFLAFFPGFAFWVIFGHFGPYCLVPFGDDFVFLNRLLKQIQEKCGSYVVLAHFYGIVDGLKMVGCKKILSMISTGEVT